MRDLIEGQQEPTFRVFSGAPDETVRNVNQSLKEYSVLNWNFAVADNKVVLTALLVSQRELRRVQLASMGPAMNHGRR